MTEDEAISKFGLPAAEEHRTEILSLIEAEWLRNQDEEGDQILITCLCIQLFSVGNVEDSLVIWNLKSSNFDLGCSIDVQLLCGAGLEVTKQFLSSSVSPLAPDALKYLDKCVTTGDFIDWTPEITLQDYITYYGIDS